MGGFGLLVCGVADRSSLSVEIDFETLVLPAEPVGGVLGRGAGAVIAESGSTVVEAGEGGVSLFDARISIYVRGGVDFSVSNRLNIALNGDILRICWLTLSRK